MSRRLEFVEGTSSKFWEVEVEGAEVITRWGRIGTAGQTKTKTYANEAAAQRDADLQHAKKVKSGYVEVAPAMAGATAKSAPVATATTAPAAVPPKAAPAGPTPALASVPVAPIGSTPGQATGGNGEAAAPTQSWAEAARAKAWPWRDWNDPTRQPLKDGHVPDMSSWEMGVGVCVPSLIEPQRQAVKILTGAAPPTADPRINAALLAIAPQAVGKVVAGAGLLGALEAAHASRELIKLERRGHQGKTCRWLGHECKSLSMYGASGDLWQAWKRLRSHLACCPQAEYDKVVHWAKKRRAQADLEERVALAVTIPDQGWAEEDAEACLRGNVMSQWGNPLVGKGLLLLASLRDAALALRLLESSYHQPEPDLVHCLLANLGSQAFRPILRHIGSADWMKPVWEIADPALAEALRAHLDERSLRGKIVEYYQRFPHLGIPVLARSVNAAGKGKEIARTLLTQILRQTAELPVMEAREAELCQSLLCRFTVPQDEAPVEDLPRVLAAPPWLEKKRASVELPVARAADPLTPYPERVVWPKRAPKAYYYQVPPPDGLSDSSGLAALQKALKGKDLVGLDSLDRLTDANALKHWNTVDPRRWYEPWSGLFPVAARFGLDGLPGLLAYAERNLAMAVNVLEAFDTPRVAAVMAQALAGIKSKPQARAWLRRFPRAALLGLIPAAVDKPGKPRGNAEEALRWMAEWMPRAEIEAVAEELKVLPELRAVLDFDPLLLLPKKIPPLAATFDPAVMPRPVLRNGKALPVEAVRHLLTMLAFTPESPPYAGLPQVKQACRPESLEEFAWELFSVWQAAGGPAKEKWAMGALAHLGGDESARRLAPLIRNWPQEQLFSRAEQGLDVLAAIGSDVALMHIYQMSQKLKSKALQQRAGSKLEEIAARRGLTSEELADRLVSDLDLDSDGSCTLSFGPRQFRVVFDEALRPGLRNSQGEAVKDLPKATASDDAAQAAASTARWKALKKDAKTLGQSQLVRLELAMGSRRRWKAEAWNLFLRQHPLLIHLVRRLLWGEYTPEGELVSCFRVAEDRTLATVDDDSTELKADHLVGLPHPLELSPDCLTAWSTVFNDYEILQPFPQLGRPVFRLTEAERAGQELSRQKGRVVHPGKVVNLENRGWRRGEAWDGGVCAEMLKPMGGERWAHLEFFDGLYLGALHESGDQTLGVVTVRENDQPLTLAALDEILVSELLADLEGVR